MTGERFGHLQNKKALLKLEEMIKITGVKPYYVKDNVVQNKGYHASRVVCKSKDDAEICCAMLNLQVYWGNFYKKDWKKLIIERDNLKEENELLKIALCEELQANGSSYHINLFEKIFNLNYDKWERKNEYIEWEDLLKGDGKND